MAVDPKEPKVVDSAEVFALDANKIPYATTGLAAPSVYAEYIRGAMVTSTVTKLNFVENRMDVIADEMKTIHVLTLILPTAQLKAIGNFLLENADKIAGLEAAQTADAAPPRDGAA